MSLLGHVVRLHDVYKHNEEYGTKWMKTGFELAAQFTDNNNKPKHFALYESKEMTNDNNCPNVSGHFM